jgi:hypothetical protein
MKKTTTLKRTNRVLFGVLSALTCFALLASSMTTTGNDSKMTVIVPNNFSGICIIGFSNTEKESDSVTVILDEHGIGKVDGDFYAFNKIKNMDFFIGNPTKKQPLTDYLMVDKNRIDTSQTYLQHGFTIRVNNKTYLLLRIGKVSYLNSEFNIDDPEIDRKIKLVSW